MTGSLLQSRLLNVAAFVVFGIVAMAVRVEAANTPACPSDDSGLKLPVGFCATIFADGIGHARHIAMSADGVLYANTWSGRYFRGAPQHPGGFLVALKDTSGDGRSDVIERFGETVEAGGAGGTGLGIYKDSLYVELKDKIVRYALPRGSLVPKGAATTVVGSFPFDGDHPMHPFLIDPSGSLYVGVGSASNSCQQQNRTPHSPGADPCTELQTRAGVWRYDALKNDQVFSPAQRYATGIRNGEGFAIDPANRIYVSQHGRDQLYANWPELYTPEQEATLPAEEVMLLERGADYGWPMCYFDPGQKKRVLAPEYGGDGGKKVGLCAGKTPPAAYFSAHIAPNALLFYTQGKFPSHYNNGLFIAFHGSWNRAPFEQKGYNIVFQPMKDGHASGKCEIFADGFAGAIKTPDKADHRPSGFALGADGALYISDDIRGRIYRIVYTGPKNADAAALKTVPCPDAAAPAGPVVPVSAAAGKTDADTKAQELPLPPGITAATVALGKRIYHGEVVPATCTGCHGADGAGTPLGPNLSDSEWLWGDGSVQSIAASIAKGVAQPKQYRAPMPAMGGTQLNNEQLNAVAAYLWSVSHRPAGSGTSAANAGEISIPGENIYPESLTSSTDGRLFIGSIGPRTIYSVSPGAKTAEPWIKPEAGNTLVVLGVFADNASNTLWACYSGVLEPKGSTHAPETLKSFDLSTGKPKASYALPTEGGLCNDIAVGADGTVYVSDSNNMEVLRLAKGGEKLSVWAGEGAFGEKGGTLDGIAVLGDKLFVSTLSTGKLFGVPIGKTGRAGKVSEIDVGRTLEHPDGMRAAGAGRLLLTENGGGGRLLSIKVSDNRGEITVLKEGYPQGPVAVTVVGSKAWVVEGQLARLFGKSAVKPEPKPFRATAIELQSP